MPSTPSVNTSAPTYAPPAPGATDNPHATPPSDNLSGDAAVNVLPQTSSTPPESDFNNPPVLDDPEQFRTNFFLFGNAEGMDYYSLLANKQQNDLEQRRANMLAQQDSADAIQEARTNANLETDKKINEQAESQAKSNAKSGFLSIFNKVFAGLTIALGVAIALVPGMLGLGIALAISGGIALATSFPEVMEKLGNAFTAMLTPLIGEEAAKKWGPILASVVVVVAQLAAMLPALINPAAALSVAAKVLKTLATLAQIAQGVTSGAVSIGLGLNNLDLAEITRALDRLYANSDLYSTQLNNLLDVLNAQYQSMSQAVNQYIQQIEGTPKISAA